MYPLRIEGLRVKVACRRTFERAGVIEQRITIAQVTVNQVASGEFDLAMNKPSKPRATVPKKDSAWDFDTIDALCSSICAMARPPVVPGDPRGGESGQGRGYGLARIDDGREVIEVHGCIRERDRSESPPVLD